MCSIVNVTMIWSVNNAADGHQVSPIGFCSNCTVESLETRALPITYPWSFSLSAVLKQIAVNNQFGLTLL